MLQAASTRDQSSVGQAHIPPAPRPQAQPLGPIALLRTLRRNPLECWATEHFEQPIVSGGLPIGHVLLVHEPRSIRHVLLDNAANYRKDRFQRRVLSAGLNDGLLSAEGEQWRIQRKVLAPMFARRNLRVLSWVGHNILGNRDGMVLSDPENKASKVKSKEALLGDLLGYTPQSHVSQCPRVLRPDLGLQRLPVPGKISPHVAIILATPCRVHRSGHGRCVDRVYGDWCSELLRV